LAFAFLASAQGGEPNGAEGETEAAPVTVEKELGDEAAPALFAVGVSAGFPSYQTVALAVSLQAQFVGAQLKGSWTPAGAYAGGQLRVYPPIPVPIPLYVGVGGSVYTDLRYSYSITGVQMSGNVGNVTVNYSGSVREILTGTRQSASGDARVRLEWTGCGWGGRSVEY